MSEHEYIAASAAEAEERARLALLGRIWNPVTFRRIEGLGIAAGWRCLEIGAGEGSVARGLAERAGPGGRVVATDLQSRFLRPGDFPGIEVRRHDITADDLEAGAFDLVHCRAVLMHLPDPRAALRRMISALRPGGRICVEEFDYASLGSAEPAHAGAERFTRSWRSIFGALRAAGMVDPYFGPRVLGLIEDAGCVEVGHEGTALVHRGGEPGAILMRMHFALVRDAMVAAGAIDAGDGAEIDRLAGDPSFRFVDATLFGAWGRRAG